MADLKRSVNAAIAANQAALILTADLILLIDDFQHGVISAQEFITAVASNGITQHRQLGAIDHALITKG